MQKGKKDPLYKSFGYAFHGIFTVIGQERNMQIHCAATVVVVILGFFLHISYEEWLICPLLFALVMSLDMVNTAVEAAVDFAAKGGKASAGGKGKGRGGRRRPNLRHFCRDDRHGYFFTKNHGVDIQIKRVGCKIGILKTEEVPKCKLQMESKMCCLQA